MGGDDTKDRLVRLIEQAEAKESEEFKKVKAQSIELEKGLSRLYSTRSPIVQRPRKRIRDNRKLVQDSTMDQIRSVWIAKIQHYMAQQIANRYTDRDYKEEDHLFTYPFITSDNSMHLCSNGLSEFSELRKKCALPDAVYAKNNFASSIVIDATSVKSLAPCKNVEDDVMNFCLSW